jgi:hypothetical protein
MEAGAPPVDAGCLRFSDALKLAIATKVGLKLREYAKHIEEAFTGTPLL